MASKEQRRHAKRIKHQKPKYRVSAEKVPSGKAGRRSEEDDDKALNTCWRAFLRPGSVHTMHARIDEERQRIVTVYTLRPPELTDRLDCPPPFPFPAEKPASE